MGNKSSSRIALTNGGSQDRDQDAYKGPNDRHRADQWQSQQDTIYYGKGFNRDRREGERYPRNDDSDYCGKEAQQPSQSGRCYRCGVDASRSTRAQAPLPPGALPPGTLPPGTLPQLQAAAAAFGHAPTAILPTTIKPLHVAAR